MKIAIGICAKNEGRSIVSMLNSLLVSCDIAKTIQPYLFICANGCSDQTIPLIENWQKQHKSFFSKLHILQDGNLVEAQRKIIKESKERSIENTIFLDADILIDKEFVLKITKELSNNTEAIAIYSKSIPVLRNNCSLIEKALNLYDISGALFSKRKHLHGRAFLIKTNKWSIPKTIPQLVTDDIYLSCYLLKTYGPESINSIDGAKVYFNQITNYQDFYNAFRRRSLEMQKCFKLFPQFKSLPEDQVNRLFLWSKLHREPLGEIFLWIILICLKRMSLIRFKIEHIFALNRKKDQWIATTTSKSK